MKLPCPVPECDTELEADDVATQRVHMTSRHQAWLDQQMEANGFRRHPLTGAWIDVWASD